MLWRQVRVEEAYGERLYARCLQCVGQRLEFTGRERRLYRASPVDPLGDLEAQLTRDERRLAMKTQVERPCAVSPADLKQIAETPGRKKSSLRTDALK